MTGAMQRQEAAKRAMLALLLACALLLRIAVPAGWMPVSDAQGTRLVPCSGAGPMEPGLPMAHAGMGAGHTHHGKAPEPHDGDHGCAFGSLSLALAQPPAPALALPPLVVAASSRLPAFVAAIGRGLAAPPPPSTGPPGLI